MAVRLRLAHFGRKHAPIFRIVAIDSRKARDGKCLENLGTYNPTTGEYVQFHQERIDDWIAKGAIPSDSVKKLCKRFKKGIQPKTKQVPQVQEVKPKKKVEVSEEPAVEAVEAKKIAATPKKAEPKEEVKARQAKEVKEVKPDAKKAEESKSPSKSEKK